VGAEHTGDGWGEVLDHLERRREASRAMGGEERLGRHRAAGKLDPRRIDHLLDPGSFLELGTLVGEEAPPTPSSSGRARSTGGGGGLAEDFTVKAGTISQASNSKLPGAELACSTASRWSCCWRRRLRRRPGTTPARPPTCWPRWCSGRVPLVTAVLSLRRAGRWWRPCPCGDDRPSIFTAGPPVVYESLGEQISKEAWAAPTWPWPAG
jgi:acetyl-CoA carboxylase carboxyltransferase component